MIFNLRLSTFFFAAVFSLSEGRRGGGDRGGDRTCEGAVSVDGSTPNVDCVEACEKSDGSDFEKLVENKKCALYNYHLCPASHRVIYDPPATCFDQWVHGYSDEGLYNQNNGNAQVGKQFETSTASECQTLCQQDKDCVRFLFRVVAENIDENGTPKYPVGVCLLKNSEMISHARSITIKEADKDSPATDPRYEWCNLGLGERCTTKDAYRCAKCEEMKCIYWSENHIAGPKFCGKPYDVCEDVPTTLETTTPAPSDASVSATVSAPIKLETTTPAPVSVTVSAPIKLETTTPAPSDASVPATVSAPPSKSDDDTQQGSDDTQEHDTDDEDTREEGSDDTQEQGTDDTKEEGTDDRDDDDTKEDGSHEVDDDTTDGQEDNDQDGNDDSTAADSQEGCSDDDGENDDSVSTTERPSHCRRHKPKHLRCGCCGQEGCPCSNCGRKHPVKVTVEIN